MLFAHTSKKSLLYKHQFITQFINCTPELVSFPFQFLQITHLQFHQMPNQTLVFSSFLNNLLLLSDSLLFLNWYQNVLFHGVNKTKIPKFTLNSPRAYKLHPNSNGFNTFIYSVLCQRNVQDLDTTIP